MVFWTASSIFFCMVCGSVTVMVSLKPVAADVISVVAFLLGWREEFASTLVCSECVCGRTRGRQDRLPRVRDGGGVLPGPAGQTEAVWLPRPILRAGLKT